MSDQEWAALRDQVRQVVRGSPASNRQLADEIGVTHSTLGRILGDGEFSPQQRTRKAVRAWLKPLETDDSTTTGRPRGFGRAANPWPDPGDEGGAEEELLEYFLENAEQMATFMATTTEDLNPTDRRKVALAILNGFKKLLIEAGEPIPPKLRELERRFVDEAE